MFDFLKEKADRETHIANKKVSLTRLLTQKFGEETMPDGKLASEDPNPENDNHEAEFSDDDSMGLNCLKGERVDPQLRIYQVDKILVNSD